MIETTPTFTDITNWNLNVHQSTGGTRSKRIATEPISGEQYFFKGSKELDTGEIRYPTEFWSEIVASKIGAVLGFPMLDYNIGYNNNLNQKIGCLSKSMIVSGENKLTEGKNYLVGFDGSYLPEKDKTLYTFEFIFEALKAFKLEIYIEKVLEIIIFDSIIGNSDRHQENWGIITNFRRPSIPRAHKDTVAPENFFGRVTRTMRNFMANIVITNNDTAPRYDAGTLRLEAGFLPHDFAPIYDSGCCLGREIVDDRVRKMLSDRQMLESYVRKGKAEIHGNDNKKKSHFELIQSVKTKHNDYVLSLIKRTRERYQEGMLEDIVIGIDEHIPSSLVECKLSNERKELMVKLITLRLETLFQII
jgi:hypothetical protein